MNKIKEFLEKNKVIIFPNEDNIEDLLDEVYKQYIEEKDHKKIVQLYKIISDWAEAFETTEHPEYLTDKEWDE